MFEEASKITGVKIAFIYRSNFDLKEIIIIKKKTNMRCFLLLKQKFVFIVPVHNVKLLYLVSITIE